MRLIALAAFTFAGSVCAVPLGLGPHQGGVAVDVPFDENRPTKSLIAPLDTLPTRLADGTIQPPIHPPSSEGLGRRSVTPTSPATLSGIERLGRRTITRTPQSITLTGADFQKWKASFVDLPPSAWTQSPIPVNPKTGTLFKGLQWDKIDQKKG